MAQVYNPVEVKVRMKRVETENGEYYIGNSDMDISLLDTVIKFYPAPDGQLSGTMVINNTKDKTEREDTNSE